MELDLQRIRYACDLTPWGSLTSALVVGMLLFGTSGTASDAYRTFLFGGVELVAFLQILVSLVVGRYLSTRRQYKNLRLMRLAFVGLGLCLGVMWATMPLTLFSPAPPHQKVIVACTCAGLIATALAFVPIAGMAECLTIPLGTASAYTLLSLGGKDWFALFGCLVIYGLFIGSVTVQVRRLLDKITLYRLETQEQRSTLQLLSGRSDAGEIWSLWETDRNGAVSFLSPDLAHIFDWKPALGMPHNFLNDLKGKYINSANEIRGPISKKFVDFTHMVNCLNESISFRDIVVPLKVNDTVALWSFTGRPMFDDHQNYCGFRGLAYDVTDTFTERFEEAHQARNDAVTGIPNRHALNEALRNALSDLGRTGRTFAFYLVDLDEFKRVNDRLGHNAGDAVLRVAAARLARVGGDGASVARFGGDEFALLLQDIDPPEAIRVAQDIVDLFSEPVKLSDQDVLVHVSVGLALAPLSGDSVESILDAADLAMYNAKQAGKNTWSCFESSMSGQIEQRRLLLGQFREAVTRREIILAYQPLIDARTLALVGFEALARWPRPDGSFVPPDRFILLAEETGLICELGNYLLEQACRTAVSWPTDLTVAVNVSVGQLHAPDFLLTLQTILKKTGLPPARLELEVTESIFMDVNSTCAGVLHGLSDMGIKLALDDFGRGYSSLGFLKEFNFYKLKLDMGFIRDMNHDRRSAAIVRSVIELASELGVVVTAEGVETRSQLDALRRYGCTQVQGYLFSPAISGDETALLAERSRFSPMHFFETGVRSA
ncbi:EAL domain-containing protein [Acetobacter sacchari]|uniref:EAL domain-containing protein n=1 Tax=Acetobacter sacchari TaxID=2661687 RepID=A0ABS3LUN6_9PROT|nr:EAL domain-containing protein [Acetobacter sacchari]MBO1359615.1 EAL domain-containing protein [Acetobacter sacchari]